jgi:DnaJ-class molecular chaperone
MKNPQKLTKKQCMQDLYKVMGVSKNSTILQIKSAYLELRSVYSDDESLKNLKIAAAI